MRINERNEARNDCNGKGANNKSQPFFAVLLVVTILVSLSPHFTAANSTSCASNSNDALGLMKDHFLNEGDFFGSRENTLNLDAAEELLPDNLTLGEAELRTKDMLLPSDDSESEFVIQALQPGEITPITWRLEKKPVEPYGGFIGLPRKLTDQVYSFCQDTGLMDFFRSLTDSDLLPDDESKLFTLKGGQNWIAKRGYQESTWDECNLHWVDVADEATFEDVMRVLAHGDFDVVLDGIGNEFLSDGLTIAGMGFVVVSQCPEVDFHMESATVGTDLFELIFPLHLPDSDVAELFVGDEEINQVAPVSHRHDVGILMSGDGFYGTEECDYTETGDLHVAVSLYLADVTENVIQFVSGDDTMVFPAPDTTDWLWAQKGRLWGEANSLKNDPGRKPFHVEDEDPIACPVLASKGTCETDLYGMRMKCLKSCNVYTN